jgi:hypothetical protein
VNNPQDKNLFLLKSIKNEMLGKSCDRARRTSRSYSALKLHGAPERGFDPMRSSEEVTAFFHLIASLRSD